jgi:hypothetical protein
MLTCWNILASLAVSITSMTNTTCREYSIKTPGDGQCICPKQIEFITILKLRNSAYLCLYYKNIS